MDAAEYLIPLQDVCNMAIGKMWKQQPAHHYFAVGKIQVNSGQSGHIVSEAGQQWLHMIFNGILMINPAAI